MVCVLPNLDLEAWVTCNGAEVVEGGDSRIEAQLVCVHVAGGASNNANKRLKVVSILEIVVLRDHSASPIEEADIEYRATHCDVEGVAHERTGSKMEMSDVCNLAEDRLDFGRSFSTVEWAFVIFTWLPRDLSRCMPLVTRSSNKKTTDDFLRVWFLVCVDPHLHIEAAMTSIQVGQSIFVNRNVNEGKSGRRSPITPIAAVEGAVRPIVLATLVGNVVRVPVVAFLFIPECISAFDVGRTTGGIGGIFLLCGRVKHM